jgi:hypothetical protein
MYAGSSGSSHGCNKNSPGNGNGKWQGLAPITNMRSSLIPYTRARAGGENRDYVFCVNQLAGGVGRRSGQFVPGADGVKDCTPTNRIDPAVLEAVRILQDLAEENGLIFALRGAQETIHDDIDDLNGSFWSIDSFYDQSQENEERVQGQMSVSIAIDIINELRILAGVLSSADVQLHEVTFISQLDADALIDKGFGFELKQTLGHHEKPVLIFGTNSFAKTPVVSIFAGGYTNSCSSSDPLMSRIRQTGVYNPSAYGGETISLAITNNSISSTNYEWNVRVLGDNFSDYPANTELFSPGDGYPWVNKNASLDAAVKAVMEPVKESTPGTSVTLTIAGTTIPVPSRFASVNGTGEYDVPILFDSELALEYKRSTIVFYTDPQGFPGERFETFWGPSLSAYRGLFDVNNELIPPYSNISKSSTTFLNSVLGSTDQKTNNPLDGVIVPRVFDFGEDNDDDPFAALSDLKDTNQAIIFTAFSGTKIARNDDEHWVIDKVYTDVSNNSTPIGDCPGIY